MKKIAITAFCYCILLLLPEFITAQRSNIWCFGDSAAIDFSSGNPIVGTSTLDSRGTCVSISDTSSNLLFYGNTRAATAGAYNTLLWNRNKQAMLGGDSIAGDGWYHELVIVPDPADDSLFYVLSIGVTYSIGLKYSVVDMRGDNGLGVVTLKNIPLLNNIRMVDCLTAIKHGNGRDWWVIARLSTAHLQTSNNTWYVFLISANGISTVATQNVGSLNYTNSGRLSFCSVTNKLCFVSYISMIELYDFDRCTGIISNPLNVEQQNFMLPYPSYWSCEFSPNGRFLYVSGSATPSTLWQFDTWATNIASTKTLIWQTSYPPYTAGALKRAPDNKIYMSCAWSDSSGNFNYPYDSTMYYPENMNLCVIHAPDSAGTACDFQPWSFYLGGKRTYWGLPNNPDYDLGPLIGSSCDTLVGLDSPSTIILAADIFVYYDVGWQSAFINAHHFNGTKLNLKVYDINGKIIFEENGKVNSPFYTKNLNCASFAKGMYIVVFETEKEKLTRKFLIE
jgi:hypothetical protein